MGTASPSTVERVVSPPRDQLDRLRTPLEPGERLVFDLFDGALPVEWQIYVQPHLNGLRPDFVLLHPRAGIAVFEVKDWNLDALDWRIELRGPRALLVGTDENGMRFAKRDPFARLEQYRTEISRLYCPALDRRAGLAAVTAGLIFPFASDEDLVQRMAPGLRLSPAEQRYVTLTGRESLDEQRLEVIFPEYQRHASRLMTPEIAQDLVHWLAEPDFSAEQRERPPLSRDQLHFVETRTESGYRRLRGPAGAGKTLVLAGRATKLAREGKDILVVSYNITLVNYLRDTAARFGNLQNAITWLNFHEWAKRVLTACGEHDAWRNLDWDDPSSHERLGTVVAEVIEAHPDLDRHDAILVDEGQDFLPSWWSALRRLLAPGGEMLLVADRAQDLYGRNGLWTERAMEGAGFSGPWATLAPSYRMPARLVRATTDYVRTYLTDGSITAPTSPQGALDVDPVDLRWIQTGTDQLAERAIEATRTSLSPINGHSSPAFADVVVLCDQIELGRKIIVGLARRGVRTTHTFAELRNDQRRQKRYFFKGDARVKATTIHSFKGWEGKHLVVVIGDARSQAARSGFYTAMTRVKRHPHGARLTVVSAARDLEPFGRRWFQFSTV